MIQLQLSFLSQTNLTLICWQIVVGRATLQREVTYNITKIVLRVALVVDDDTERPASTVPVDAWTRDRFFFHPPARWHWSLNFGLQLPAGNNKFEHVQIRSEIILIYVLVFSLINLIPIYRVNSGSLTIMIYMLILLNIMKKENIPGCAESATIENTDKFRHNIILQLPVQIRTNLDIALYIYMYIYLFICSLFLL